MKKIAFALTVLAAVFSAQAALIVNGTMDASQNGTIANTIQYSDVGQGWVTKGSVANTTASASWRTNALNQLEYYGTNESVGQINAVTTETGDAWQLKFDWTPVAGDLTLEYQLIGWQLGATTPAAGDAMILAINWGGANISAIGGGTAVNLISGSSTTGANVNLGLSTVTGTAGTTGSYTIDVDLSALDAGFQDMSDYDYIGVRFSSISGDANPGGTLDNVSVIPEPATLGMLGLGTLIALFLRRKASK